MRKCAIIVALGLALILGLTLAASAVVINDPWSPNGPMGTLEKNLYAIFNAKGIGPGFTNSGAGAGGLQATYPTGIISTLSIYDGPGYFWAYSLTSFYATFAGFQQSPGTYPAGGGLNTDIGSPFPTSADQNQIVDLVTPIDLTWLFLPGNTDAAGNFGFYDRVSADGTKFTEAVLNGGSMNGLIFQIDDTHFVVCFEDGDGNQPLGDQDYQDLVLFVTRTLVPIPIPPSAVLLGSGLLGMAGLGWWRRK